MKNVLYVHGYHGTPNGSAFKLFKEHLNPDEFKLFGLNYEQKDATVAIKSIYDVVIKNNIEVIIASSLGAFLTMQLTFPSDINPLIILINPCMAPSVEIPKIMTDNDIDIETYKKWEQLDIDFESGKVSEGLDFTDMYGFFGDSDELLSDRYHEWWKMLTGKPVLRINSGHKVSELAAVMISKFIEATVK